MTNQEINAAIAESCPEVHRAYFSPDWTPDWAETYTTDLNAMHEVVNSLTVEERITVRFLEAKARIWAEAYLRTKGLWK